VSVSESERVRQAWDEFRHGVDDHHSVIPHAASLYQRAYDLAKECDAHRAPDRSALLHVAGSVAVVLSRRYHSPITAGESEQIAGDSVRIARAIMAEVDRPQPGETPITATTE
jgi:hypothetical protein